MKYKKASKVSKESFREQQLLLLQKRYPTQCFCEPPSYSEEDYIGETEKVHYSINDRACEHPFSYPKYTCKNCNKIFILKKGN